MAVSFGSRLIHAWNAFFDKNDRAMPPVNVVSSSYRPDRPRLSRGNERTITSSIYNRISLDVAAVTIQHVRVDQNGRYVETINSGLNNCLTLEANIDQTSRAFIQDVVLSMFDEGVVAIVPVDTTEDPNKVGSYDIKTVRTGKILEWYPRHVKLLVYNDRTGQREEIIMPKTSVAIVENPLYAVINEPNSTMQRLVRKLALLDRVDEESSSGKLDLIIQLPYVIKTEARRQQAERRRKEIEDQLQGSRYGIAYTDGTEKITQLNRSLENNLIKQIEYLTDQLYSQLGLTVEIMNGTADEKNMLNYQNRTVEPIVAAIVDGIKRVFLTKTARTQGQTIMAFKDPFRLVPALELADIADKFTRNEIMSSNEIRQIIGLKPADDPKADELRNKNISQSKEDASGGAAVASAPMTEEAYQNSMRNLEDLDSQLIELQDELRQSAEDYGEVLEHYASPYYDPVKAHEYYMRTRKLKGRSSTSGLNEEGRKAASYVRNQLNEERKKKVEDSKNRRDSEIENVREETASEIQKLREETDAASEAYRIQTQGKIDDLREKLEGMSSLMKKLNAEKIGKQIQDLLVANQNERARLENEYRNSSSNLREDQKTETASLREQHSTRTQQYKDEYNQKYERELEKLKSEEKYQSKRKKSSSSD